MVFDQVVIPSSTKYQGQQELHLILVRAWRDIITCIYQTHNAI